MEFDWVKIIAVGGCVLWGIKQMRSIYRSLGRQSAGITVHNGEYKALVENLEQLKRATAEMLIGYKMTANILGSMTVKQEAMAGILEALPCRASGPQLSRPTQLATTCVRSASNHPSANPPSCPGTGE